MTNETLPPAEAFGSTGGGLDPNLLTIVPVAKRRRTEWGEIRRALRQEYGHPYTTHNGTPCMDFSKHVYVGRAAALLWKAEKQEAALRDLVECKSAEERAADMAMSGKARAEDLQRMYNEYQKRQPLAWAEARRLLGPNV